MKAFRSIVNVTLCTLLSVGCASILGIEDAELASSDGASGGSAGDPGAGGTETGGSGGSGGGGGSSGSGGSGGSTSEPTLCESYCNTVMENCPGELGVYTSVDVCLALCATMPEGDPGALTGDSVECRLGQATAAGVTQEPGEHCPVAGLGGADVCGENCPAFCRAVLEVCPGEYASNAACLDDCESLEDLGGFDLTQSSGATVQCRIWHIGAATQASVPHCAHSAGADPCVEQ